MGARQFLGPKVEAHSLITTIGASNYTIPAGARSLTIVVKGGAAGGGSGRRGAAGTVRCGGGGGGQGAVIRMVLTVPALLADFPTGIIPCWVGFGGTGGAAQTVDSTNGLPGGNGDVSWLGSATYILAKQGGGGAGGTTSSGAGGTNGGLGGTEVAITGASAVTTGASGPTVNVGQSPPGGGITAADVVAPGNVGMPGFYSYGVGGSGGVIDTTPPTSGTVAHVWTAAGATPGAGAASKTMAAQAGANAALGSCAGGAGGGASLNGFASGAGGNGDQGFIRIFARF